MIWYIQTLMDEEPRKNPLRLLIVEQALGNTFLLASRNLKSSVAAKVAQSYCDFTPPLII